MLKKVAIYLISGAVMAGVASCNSGTSSTVISSEASSEVAVTAFSLKANENILSSLDSVYFSIDLNNARIFNADSLPKGTDISRMLVNITTGYVSKAELRFKNINLRDTVIDYDSDNTTDSIDFAAGPVTLHLVALDGTTTRDYSIEINVHTIVSDTLMWQPEARRNLPSTLSAPEAQKTVKSGETYVCMTTESGNVSIATAQDPAGQWDSQSVTLPMRLCLFSRTTEICTSLPIWVKHGPIARPHGTTLRVLMARRFSESSMTVLNIIM